MAQEQFISISIVAVSLAMGIIDALMARGITYYAARTDNEHIVKTAAQIEQWGGWPSGMHKFSSGKTHMKEFAVMMLAVVQRFLRDRSGDFPLVFLCIAMNALSAILIYVITVHYWTMEVALFVFALYVTSFWPKLIALWGGIVLLAQVNALIAVYFLQLAEITSWAFPGLWYGAAGFTSGLMLFSSASSRKYIPFCLAAFFYSLRDYINPSIDLNLRGSTIGMSVMSLSIFLLIFLLGLRLNLKNIVTLIFEKKAPAFLNRFVPINKDKNLDHYLKMAAQALHPITQTTIFIALYLLINLAVSRSVFYWKAQLFLFLGIGLAIFTMTYPNVLKNLKGYYFYTQYGKPIWRSRFFIYREYFASIGKPIRDDMRGAGIPWLHRFFHQIMPPVYYLSALSVMVLEIFVFWPAFDLKKLVMAIAIILLSFSPVLIGELTKGVQVGRSYFPALLGFLFIIGAGLSSLQQMVSWQPGLWMVAIGIIVLSGFWNAWIYLTDVYPSRMATTNLIKALKKFGIKKFYTYDTPYNDVFVNNIPPLIKQEFDIKFIRNLKEIHEGYVVVPGTNSMASVMYDFPLARSRNRRFESDSHLNYLIETKEIKRYAVERFKTLASSRMWVHEGEVPSYRDLILKEITDEDRWRGYAWILDVGKLNGNFHESQNENKSLSNHV